MNTLLFLSDVFLFAEELHPDLGADIEPVLDAYMREVLDEPSYALFAYLYADGTPGTGKAAATALRMPLDEIERRYQSGVCDLRFNLSSNVRLTDFVVEWCPEFATDHLLMVRQEYENMRRMLQANLGNEAVDQQDGLGSTLLRPNVLGRLRHLGIRCRSQARCLRFDELVERLGFKPATAERIVRAVQRK